MSYLKKYWYLVLLAIVIWYFWLRSPSIEEIKEAYKAAFLAGKTPEKKYVDAFQKLTEAQKKEIDTAVYGQKFVGSLIK